MTKLDTTKIRGLLLTIIACVVFFFAGVIVAKNWFAFPNQTTTVSQKPTKPSILTFTIPQISLPSDWSSKENLPGNSFGTALALNPGIKTQGTFNDNNAIDYYVFNLKDPSQVILNVTDVPKALYWVLYNDQLQEMASTYRTGASAGSTQMAIQNPGKYYIKVWADYHTLTNYPYTIRLNILPYFE